MTDARRVTIVLVIIVIGIAGLLALSLLQPPDNCIERNKALWFALNTGVRRYPELSREDYAAQQSFAERLCAAGG
jgi:hypothetical protein